MRRPRAPCAAVPFSYSVCAEEGLVAKIIGKRKSGARSAQGI